MAEKEYLTERSRYLIDLLRLSCLLLLAVGGGTISLMLGEPRTLKTLLAAVGAALIIGLVTFVWFLDNRIRATLEKLKEV